MSRKQKIQIIRTNEPIYDQHDDDDCEIELKRPIERPKAIELLKVIEQQNDPVIVQEEKRKRKRILQKNINKNKG
jgi:hypothetical protein